VYSARCRPYVSSLTYSKSYPTQTQPTEDRNSPEDTHVVTEDADDNVAEPTNVGLGVQTLQAGNGDQPTVDGATNDTAYDVMGGNASFAGMNFGGDLNQMQMMMAMQNGMMPGFNFPMMGMSVPCGLTSSEGSCLRLYSRLAQFRHGSHDAKHVHERRLRISGHGHERHEHDGRWLWQHWL